MKRPPTIHAPSSKFYWCVGWCLHIPEDCAMNPNLPGNHFGPHVPSKNTLSSSPPPSSSSPSSSSSSPSSSPSSSSRRPRCGHRRPHRHGGRHCLHDRCLRRGRRCPRHHRNRCRHQHLCRPRCHHLRGHRRRNRHPRHDVAMVACGGHGREGGRQKTRMGGRVAKNGEGYGAMLQTL